MRTSYPAPLSSGAVFSSVLCCSVLCFAVLFSALLFCRRVGRLVREALRSMSSSQKENSLTECPLTQCCVQVSLAAYLDVPRVKAKHIAQSCCLSSSHAEERVVLDQVPSL